LKDAFTALGAKIADGILEIKNIVTGKLTIQQFNNSTSGQTNENTIGEGVIIAGATSTIIEAPALGIYDKIFVTSEKPVALGVVARSAGSGFTVGLAGPVEYDTFFDWWIVGVKVNSTMPQDNNGTSTVGNATTTDSNNQNTTTTDSGVSATTTESAISATSTEPIVEESSATTREPVVESATSTTP